MALLVSGAPFKTDSLFATADAAKEKKKKKGGGAADGLQPELRNISVASVKEVAGNVEVSLNVQCTANKVALVVDSVTPKQPTVCDRTNQATATISGKAEGFWTVGGVKEKASQWVSHFVQEGQTKLVQKPDSKTQIEWTIKNDGAKGANSPIKCVVEADGTKYTKELASLAQGKNATFKQVVKKGQDVSVLCGHQLGKDQAVRNEMSFKFKVP